MGNPSSISQILEEAKPTLERLSRQFDQAEFDPHDDNHPLLLQMDRVKARAFDKIVALQTTEKPEGVWLLVLPPDIDISDVENLTSKDASRNSVQEAVTEKMPGFCVSGISTLLGGSDNAFCLVAISSPPKI